MQQSTWKKLGNFCQLTTASQGRIQLCIHFELGKLSHFRKLWKKWIGLLQCFQNKEGKEIEPAQKLVKTVKYPGKDNKSVAETISRMCKKQKQKSCSNLIPDQSSPYKHFKSAKLQIMTWNQCCKENFVYPGPIDYGWMKEDVLKPCWFEGRQLPLSLWREKKKTSRIRAGV